MITLKSGVSITITRTTKPKHPHVAAGLIQVRATIRSHNYRLYSTEYLNLAMMKRPLYAIRRQVKITEKDVLKKLADYNLENIREEMLESGSSERLRRV